ncbi:MAG: hypothetical protein ACR2OZ_18965 [Verrucomicrobiales bacterium]
MRSPVLIAMATLNLMALSSVLSGAPLAAKPKFSIKQVMKDAIKGDHALVKKACKGTASPGELAKMVEYFKAMRENIPPRGDLESWEQKTAALVAAAERLQKEPASKDASFQLEQAVECRQCHNEHKPSKK